MSNYTSLQKQLIDDDGTRCEVVISFPNHEIDDITNDKIYQESMSLSESIMEGEDIVFGKCNGSCFKITVADFPEDITHAEINVTLNLSNDALNANLSIPFGKYIVESVTKSGNRRYKDIVAYDFMTKFDVDIADWYNTVLYTNEIKSRTVKSTFTMLMNHLGIEYDRYITFANGNTSITKNIDPTTLSARDFLQALLEINCVFGHFDGNGIFRTIKFDRLNKLQPHIGLYPHTGLRPTSGFIIEPDKVKTYRECDYADYDVKPIDSVQIRHEDNDIGVVYSPTETYENTYILQGNYFTFGLNEAQLQNFAKSIYNIASKFYYRPSSTVVKGGLYMDLGTIYDAYVVDIKSDSVIEETKFTSYVLKREISGIQALFSNLSAEGTEYQAKVKKDVNSEFLALNGKYHNLVVDLEKFSSEIGNRLDGQSTLIGQNADAITLESNRASGVEESLNSKIDITAESITQTVNNLQKQVNGQVTKYSGSAIPTLSNYPASSWNDTQKAANVGSVYTINDEGSEEDKGKSYRFMYDDTKGYYWQELTDTEIAELKAQIIELSSEIEQTADSITQTVSKSMQIWNEVDNDGNPLNIKYYNFGTPLQNEKQWKDTAKYRDLYLNQQDGKVYYYAGGTDWNDYIYLQSYVSISQSQIEVLSDAIELEVIERLNEEENIYSKISQTAHSIDLSVNNGNTSSGITIKLLNEDGTPLVEEDANIEMQGLVSFTDLQNSNGKTLINGSNIKTGTIDASKVVVTNLNANNIKSGTISGIDINAETFSCKEKFNLKYNSSDVFGITYTYKRPFAQTLIKADSASDLTISSGAGLPLYLNGDGVYINNMNPIVSNGSVLSMLRAYNPSGTNPNYIHVNMSDGTSWGITIWTSDTKLKKNIERTNVTALDKIKKIDFVQFDWKDNDSHVDLGVSANQLEEVIPSAVFEVNQPNDSEFDILKNVNTGVMTTYALKAIQEQQNIIESQQKEIDTLKEQVSFLMQKSGGNN